MDIRIITADWDQDRERIRNVRRTVFVVEQRVPEEEEWDDADADCHHILAVTAQGDVIGTGRLLDSGKIGRLAVLKPWRKAGVGSQLLQALLDHAAQRGLPRVYLHAQQTSVPFYERFGFLSVGDPFMEANIPHQRMERLL